MEWLVAHLDSIQSVLTIVGSIWAGLKLVDAKLRAHLADTFASKEDLKRVEHKVDRIYMAVVSATRSRRSGRDG